MPVPEAINHIHKASRNLALGTDSWQLKEMYLFLDNIEGTTHQPHPPCDKNEMFMKHEHQVTKANTVAMHTETEI
jgi:hypothetical protein